MRKLSFHIAVFSLAALMLLKMLGMPLAYLSYHFNKEYIANQLCENRYKPTMHCNGQCILMKKLAKANESTESKESKTEVKSIGIDFIEEPMQITFDSITTLPATYTSHQDKTLPSSYISSVFHPPGSIA